METTTHVATIRIPTDQYAYIEIETEGTPDDIIATYRSLKNAYNCGEGLLDKDWRMVLDRYLWEDGKMEQSQYESMSEIQQLVIQEIKKSKKRSKYDDRELQDRNNTN